MNPDISPIIKEKAPLILAEIQKANSILLHCHPSPDPDSVGSSLAMKFVLERMHKKVTIIGGDSQIPEAFMHFPGAQSIVAKNISEIALNEFDLFIIQDSSTPGMISFLHTPEFPMPLTTIIIDHHRNNTGFATLNLVEPAYPANCQILADLFTLWNVEMDTDIAKNLFMGIFTDTGFKYPGVNAHTFDIVAHLVKYIPSISELVNPLDFSSTPTSLAFVALGFNNITVQGGGHFAMTALSYSLLKEKNIPELEMSPSILSSALRRVKGWYVTAALVETEPGHVTMSFRSQDISKYDVSILAVAFLGGGHKGAAGARVAMSLEEAKKAVVTKVQELYKL